MFFQVFTHQGDIYTRRVITIRDSKNNESRHIPINTVLHKVLKNVIKNVDDSKVFWDAMMNFRKKWDRTIKRAGIRNSRFYDLRHTFASYLVMSGVDLKTVQELTGHKTFAMTLRYSHLSPEHKQGAIEKLADVIGGIPQNADEVATYLQHEKVAHA
jgi:integrase